ncbi:MAG: hypothetical protein ABI343_03315 [Burkholderiaceae bacterium]
MNDKSTLYVAEPNRDPLTGEPGAHPMGTGIGAALGGAAAGAVTGTAAGPLGTVVGAALGAIVGGLAGKSAAEAIDPTSEDLYWRDHFVHRPYAQGATFDDYGPAYGYGVHAVGRHPGRRFEDVEAELARDWDSARGRSRLEWARAREAARDAWMRVGGPG